MLDKFLRDLQDILNENQYDDTENIISYYREMIMDKKENGESEAEILEEFGDVNEVASNIIGSKVIRHVLRDDNKYEVQEIFADVKSIDIKICADDVEEMEIDAPSDDSIEVTSEDQSLSIIEKQKLFVPVFGKRKIMIRLPKDRVLKSISLNSVSGDFKIKGQLEANAIEIKTVSGDIKVKRVQSSEIHVKTTSGNANFENLSFNHLDFSSVSGDGKVKECTGYQSHMKSVSGDLECKENDIEQMSMVSTSGDIRANLLGSESEYTVINKKQRHGNGSKALEMKTVSGDIEYFFSC